MPWSTFVTVVGQVVLAVIVLCLIAVVVMSAFDSIRKSHGSQHVGTHREKPEPSGHVDEDDSGIRD